MKQQLLILLLSLLGSLSATAQGIEFFQGTWEQALQEARKQSKVIFVDAYAKWCGPCKKMAATTFKNEEVGSYFNQHFINVKLDMEEGEGLQFRKKYPVSAFPTLFFIDGSGEVVQKAVGAQDAPGLLKLGEKASGKVDYSKDYAAEYNKGNRDPELIFNYVQALNKSGKPSLAISNEYLKAQQDLGTDFNLRFILEAAVQADSRIFDLLIKYQQQIARLENWQLVRDRIALACTNTAKKAAEFQSTELLEEAKAKMKSHYQEKAASFAAEMDLHYYKATADAKNFGKACSAYAEEVAHGDPKALHRLAGDILALFSKDEKCMKLAEKYAREAAEKGRQVTYYLTYAEILQTNGKKKQAADAAREALSLAKAAGDPAEQQIRQLLERLES
jgi:thiol-disulfide isomerase/thioredoxin